MMLRRAEVNKNSLRYEIDTKGTEKLAGGFSRIFRG